MLKLFFIQLNQLKFYSASACSDSSITTSSSGSSATGSGVLGAGSGVFLTTPAKKEGWVKKVMANIYNIC